MRNETLLRTRNEWNAFTTRLYGLTTAETRIPVRVKTRSGRELNVYATIDDPDATLPFEARIDGSWVMFHPDGSCIEGRELDLIEIL